MKTKQNRMELTKTLENICGKDTFDDVKKNDSLYYSYFIEAVLDGSIKQNIDWNDEEDKQMMDDFDEDYLDYKGITTHYKNLIKGKQIYENKNQK
jgi:hypothetical protein